MYPYGYPQQQVVYTTTPGLVEEVIIQPGMPPAVVGVAPIAPIAPMGVAPIAPIAPMGVPLQPGVVYPQTYPMGYPATNTIIYEQGHHHHHHGHHFF